MSHDEYPTVNERMAEQMTHDELLAEIGYNAERTSNALRAVVELCKDPEDFGNGIALVRVSDVIQAIEEQIK